MEIRYAALLASTLALAACSESGHVTEAPTVLPVVSVVQVAATAVPLSDEMSGRVLALRTADIRPQVGGIVRRRLFDQGAEVRAGLALFQLDPAPLKAEHDAAAAALQHANATLARAEQQLERLQTLVDNDAISRQSYDDALSERRLAAAVQAQARANLERKRLDLAFATVRAPISGRIGAELVSEGTLVAPADATPLARIVQIDQVYVDLRQPAAMLAGTESLGPAEAHSVQLLSADGQPLPTTAKRLFSEVLVDASTGDRSIRLLVDNPERRLLPGMFVRARLSRSTPQAAILIPQQAVQRQADGTAMVWLLDKTGKATQRSVTVGAVIQHQYLLRSGLAEGETLVIEGQERLQEGSQTKSHPWKLAAPAVQATANTSAAH